MDLQKEPGVGGSQMAAWGDLASYASASVESGHRGRVELSFRIKSGYRSEVQDCGATEVKSR